MADTKRDPLSWEDVRNLDDAGFHDIARIAEHYVRRAERRRNRWYRRLWRRLGL